MKIDFKTLHDGMVVSHAEIIDGQGDTVSVYGYGKTDEEAKTHIEEIIEKLMHPQ